MSTSPNLKISPEEFLERERGAEGKSEYLNGEVFAMAGANRIHRKITTNILSFMDRMLENGICEADNSDTRIFIPATGLYTYADALAYCGDPQYLDDQLDTLLNPVLIVEVLSASTEAYDRGSKFDSYRSISSFREYVLVSTKRLLVERFLLQDTGEWMLTIHKSADDSVPLTSVGIELPLASAYRNLPDLLKHGG